MGKLLRGQGLAIAGGIMRLAARGRSALFVGWGSWHLALKTCGLTIVAAILP